MFVCVCLCVRAVRVYVCMPSNETKAKFYHKGEHFAVSFAAGRELFLPWVVCLF